MHRRSLMGTGRSRNHGVTNSIQSDLKIMAGCILVNRLSNGYFIRTETTDTCRSSISRSAPWRSVRSTSVGRTVERAI
jgi:hypothetical protein